MSLAGPIRLRVLPALLPQEIELQVSATHIQWRYVGAATWIDLIALAELETTFVGAYDNGTTYPEKSIVLYQGSSWVSLQETVGNPPPTLPTTSNAFWQLVSQKGNDGTLIGPGASTDNAITRFDGTAGAIVQDSLATVDDAGRITSVGLTSTGSATISLATGTSVLNLATADPGASGVFVEYYHNSVSPAVNDVIYNATYFGNDSGAAKQQYAQDLIKISDAVAGTEDATREFYLTIAGANVQMMAFNAGGLRALMPIDLSAGQIQFPASQNPSANANTFDDYSEFTFTPRIDGTTAAGAGTYSVQTGSGTKAGRIVTYDALLVWSAHTGTGNMVIAGLPFTSAATFTWPCALVPSNLTAANPLYGRVTAAATTIQLGTAASAAAFTALAIDTAASIDAAGHYHV